jgi:hypothetical protein
MGTQHVHDGFRASQGCELYGLVHTLILGRARRFHHALGPVELSLVGRRGLAVLVLELQPHLAFAIQPEEAALLHEPGMPVVACENLAAAGTGL